MNRMCIIKELHISYQDLVDFPRVHFDTIEQQVAFLVHENYLSKGKKIIAGIEWTDLENIFKVQNLKKKSQDDGFQVIEIR